MRLRSIRLLPLAFMITSAGIGTTSQAASSAIRKIDFRNFTYALDSSPVTVANGVFDTNDPADPLHFEVVDVDHGDLDGDGVSEAVVSLVYNTGGTGNFTESRVFKLVGSKPVEVTTFGGGDRADGGTEDVVITTSGIVRVQFFGGNGGSCCPEYIEQTDFRLKGSSMVPVPGKKLIRGIDRIGDSGPESKAIRFRNGTSGSLVYLDGGSSGYFDAAKGQTVSLDVKSPNSGSFKLSLLGSNATPIVKTTTAAQLTTRLPASGRYKIVADGSPDTSVRVLLDIR